MWVPSVSVVTGTTTSHVRSDRDHASTITTIYDRINAGDLDGFAAFVAEDFVEHEVNPGVPPTKAGVLEFFRLQLDACPDTRMEVEDLIVGGDKVVARVRHTGTRRADFVGIPATGRSVDVALVDIFALGSDGLVHEHWGVMDAMALIQQLGVVPEGPPA